MTNEPEAKPPSPEERPIILVAKKTSNRDSFERSLAAVKMPYEIVERLSDVHATLAQHGASVLVHVLEEFERGEVGVFHHRLARSDEGRRLARFLIYRGTNERAVSFAADVGMLRAIQAEHALSTLGYSLQLALKAHYDLEPDLRDAIELAAPGDCCAGPEQLEALRTAAKKYPLIENLAIAAAYIGLIVDGDAEGALKKGQSLLNRSPANVRAMTLVGEALIQLKEFDAAAKVLLRAETLAAGNPCRLALIGRIAAATGALDSAKKCLFKSLEISPVRRAIGPLIAQLELTTDEMKSVREQLALKFSADEIKSIIGK